MTNNERFGNGGLRWLTYNQFSVFPYSTQVCCVIGLLLFQNNNNNNNNKDEIKLKGRIAQVLTGEGKSTIVSLLAAYCGMLERQIDIITTSEYLAIRDYEKYQPFFKSIGISCSQICGEHPLPQLFNAQVLFGTNTNFEFALLRDKLYGSMLLYTNGLPLSKDLVIVDEVDSLFIDSALNSARMAISSVDHHGFIYKPISNYVNNFVEEFNSTDLTVNEEDIVQVRDLITSCANDLPYDEKIKSSSLNWINNTLDHEKIKNILETAVRSFQLKEGHDYVILNGDSIVLVDKENTGRLMIGSRYSNGLHEFIEVKHGLQPKQETLTATSISHPSFFNQYNGVFGLTGTCGEDKERVELSKVYNVDSFNVPSYLDSKRVKLPSKLLDTKQEYEESIYLEINEILSLSRPVLLLLPTITDSEHFIKFLKSKGIPEPQLLNEMQQQDEEFIITKAGESNSLTIATNTAGRGTDIKLSSEALSNGRLHVIFGFYPNNLRVESQGLGRAGRQGLDGSSIPWYCFEGDILSIELLDMVRSQICCSLSDTRLSQCQIEKKQYQLLEKFFNLLSIIRTFCKSGNLISIIQNSISNNKNNNNTTNQCSCNEHQFSTFLNSISYNQFSESS
ncbi:hypothetical protein ACTFIY_000376 [Dictyostelium cf. discoideum]